MRDHRWNAWALSFVLAALSLGPSAALAQDDDASTEQARELFGSGVGHMDNQEWEQAVEQFRAAYALVQAPAIAFNLASSLIELGHRAEPFQLLTLVIADDTTPRTILRQARRMHRRIDGQFGHLAITLAGTATPDVVMVDQRELSTAELAEPVPMDPGVYVVTARLAGTELAREPAEVRAGEQTDLELTADLPPEPEPEPEPIEPAPVVAEVPPIQFTEPTPAPLATEPTDGGSAASDWRLWAGVGAAVVVTTVIVVAIAAGGGTEDPVQGTLEPGVLTWP